jgi:hypothetical protein
MKTPMVHTRPLAASYRHVLIVVVMAATAAVLSYPDTFRACCTVSTVKRINSDHMRTLIRSTHPNSPKACFMAEIMLLLPRSDETLAPATAVVIDEILLTRVHSLSDLHCIVSSVQK